MDIREILEQVSGLTFTKNLPPRERTAETILESGQVGGCSDVGLAFAYLCQQSGIRAHLVDSINREWIREPTKTVRGHVYCMVLGQQGWVAVDPTTGRIGVNPIQDGRIPVLSYLKGSLLSPDELRKFSRLTL